MVTDFKLENNKKKAIINISLYPSDNVKINGSYIQKEYNNTFIIEGDNYIQNVIGTNINTVIDNIF